MSVVIVVGAQWGDEGKGKVVDLFTERADMVVRYGGGANAGHTLVIGGQKLVTHLVPSGVCHPGKSCVLGDGMVIDPQTLLEELTECKSRGVLARGELLIGLGAHVILPYHKLLDGLREDRGAKVGKAIGTTRREIGPAYEAKAARRGVRMRDLLKPARLRDLVDRAAHRAGARRAAVMLGRLAEWANGDARLVRLGRACSAVVLVQVGDSAFRVAIHQGRVESVESGAGPMPRYTFALRAPAEEWARFWLPVPPPGSNDLLALRRRQVLSVEGDVRIFMAYLRYFKELLALPRGKGTGR